MAAYTSPEQGAFPCVLMRGGTSKALFFHERDIPAAGPERDRMLKRAMGTPDALQIDGMGGSRLVTSKVAIIERSKRGDADVDYTFAQVDTVRDLIGYTANCGNISSAVAPFAIDEGIVEAVEPVTTVRIFNTNTATILIAKVQVRGGKARVLGDCAIPGVPGTGAAILMDWAGSIGAKTGRMLPTGHVVDPVVLEDGRRIHVTICDAANPCVFIAAADLGLTGCELPPAISADQRLIDSVAEIQAKAGLAVGMWDDWKAQHRPGLPLAVIVSPPADYVDTNGVTQAAASMDLRARLVFLGQCHDSMAGSGAICSAAASRVPGSVVNRQLPEGRAAADELRIGHPLGVMEVRVDLKRFPSPQEIHFDLLGFTRTARRLMAGTIYVPVESPRPPESA